MSFQIKVCGMKDHANIQEVASCGIDFMGFIFYEKSKRYVGENFNLDNSVLKNNSVKSVGVFVNHSTAQIEQMVLKHQLDVIQLHGDETALQCGALKENKNILVKAFQVDDHFDFRLLEPYKKYVDYFLFDTKSEGYGGTGQKYNWEILKQYDNELPLFLSGGIDLNSVESIKALSGMNIKVLDLNSKFEIVPGIKEVSKIKEFVRKFK